MTPFEKDTFSRWTSKDEDNSITETVLSLLWNRLLHHAVPDSVSANVLSLGGLLCLVHAWYLCFLYMAVEPRWISLGACALIVAYLVLDGVDGKHAARTRTDSPLGEFFAHCCCNVGFVFSTLTACYVLGIEDLSLRWYLVQIGQLIALRCHIRAFKSKVISYSKLTSPGEGFFVLLLIMGTKALFPSLFGQLSGIVTTLINTLNSLGMSLDPNNHTALFALLIHTLFYGLIVLTLLDALSIPKQNQATRNGIAFCLIYRLGPAFLMWLGVMPGSFTTWDLISEGLFMSLLTSDIILAKMANRDLHPYIVIFSMVSVLDNFIILLTVAIYYTSVLYDISDYMQLSVFGVVRNVYVDGVYDMCHLGHFNSFKKALSYGNRLIVGVLSDEHVQRYKRSPIMTMKERAEVVATSRFVHKVIAPCPFPGIPEEFIREHRIHVVCHSTEYDKPDDIYYVVPRAMGITRVMPRTEGMSTSELIKRVKAY
uniref:ethanolamine-phosphate cytidylyltransferase n=1 Tax=Arcella intermedia TaxID=1963864 RepID=A0A6B2L2Q3_9EUKA